MAKIIVECNLPTPTVPQIRIPEESTILCVKSVMDPKKRLVNIFFTLLGYALGIWISGCSLFYRRELWASKSAGVTST